MMYIKICEAFLDVWWMSKCIIHIYKYDACKINVWMSIIFFYAGKLEKDAQNTN